LVIDSDAVLPRAVPPQGFQPVSGWYGQISEGDRSIKLIELAPCHRLNADEARDESTSMQRASFRALE